MRVLKFRVWDIVNKEFHYGPSMKFFIGLDGKLFDSYGCCYNEKEYVVQEFTGLLDKNGREIYDGDILEYDGGKIMEWNMYPGKHICRIYYCEEDLAFYVKSKTFKWYIAKSQSDKIKVIGNIFDNPKLIK